MGGLLEAAVDEVDVGKRMDKAMRKYEQCGEVAKKSNGSWRHG
jgi:hypothetical protein